VRAGIRKDDKLNKGNMTFVHFSHKPILDLEKKTQVQNWLMRKMHKCHITFVQLVIPLLRQALRIFAHS